MTKQLPYLFLLPALLFCAAFSVLPLLMVGQLSFFRTDYVASVYVGLSNFARMATDRQFWLSVINCLLYSAVIVPVQVGSALLISFLLVDCRKRFMDVMRFVLYVPSFASGIIMARTWRWIFETKGVANFLLGAVGLPHVPWLLTRAGGIAAVSVAIMVLNTGVSVIVLSGAMLSVSPELIDAARIDGATERQVKARIVLPMIFPAVGLMMLMLLIGTMQMWETAYYLTAGSPMGGTATIVMDIIKTGFEGSDYGLAAAKGLVAVGIIGALSVVKRRAERI